MSGTRPLSSYYRWGLAFGFCNTFAWMIPLQHAMLLFLERMGATQQQANYSSSYLQLLLPVQVLATFFLPRTGYKRLLAWAWGIRTLVMAIPLTIASMASSGVEPWMIPTVLGGLFLFCLTRAGGGGVWIPWMCELIPAEEHGRYFTRDTYVSASAALLCQLLSAACFKWLGEWTAFVVLLGVATAGGAGAIYSLLQLPDPPRPPRRSLREFFAEAPKLCLTPGPFRSYLGLLLWLNIGSPAYTACTTFFQKRVLDLSRQDILLFSALGNLAAICLGVVLRHRADRLGPKPFFLISFGTLVTACCVWLAVSWHMLPPLVAMTLISLLVGINGSCWVIAHLKYLSAITTSANRALAMTLHTAVVGLWAGLTPVFWGWAFGYGETAGAMNMTVARTFFIVHGCIHLTACWLLRDVKSSPSDDQILAPEMWLRPFRTASAAVVVVAVKARELTRAPFRSGGKKD